MQNFIILQQFLKIPPFSSQICLSSGGRGGPWIYFWVRILQFLLVRNSSGLPKLLPGRTHFTRIKMSVHIDGGRSRVPGLDPPLGPPLTWAEICWHTCLHSHLQTSPPTHQKSYPKFCISFLLIVREEGGSPIFLFLVGILLFCELGAHAKCRNATMTIFENTPFAPPYMS